MQDDRLHSLRHMMASHAVMNGVPVPVVSRMHGHINVRKALRCAHLEDPDIEASAERVGTAMARVVAGRAEVAVQPVVRQNDSADRNPARQSTGRTELQQPSARRKL